MQAIRGVGLGCCAVRPPIRRRMNAGGRGGAGAGPACSAMWGILGAMLPLPIGDDLLTATGGSVVRGVKSLLQRGGARSAVALEDAGRTCQLDKDAVPHASSDCGGSAWYLRNRLTMQVASSFASASEKEGASCLDIGPTGMPKAWLQGKSNDHCAVNGGAES